MYVYTHGTHTAIITTINVRGHSPNAADKESVGKTRIKHKISSPGAVINSSMINYSIFLSAKNQTMTRRNDCMDSGTIKINYCVFKNLLLNILVLNWNSNFMYIQKNNFLIFDCTM